MRTKILKTFTREELAAELEDRGNHAVVTVLFYDVPRASDELEALGWKVLSAWYQEGLPFHHAHTSILARRAHP